jgi:hypothetical protein
VAGKIPPRTTLDSGTTGRNPLVSAHLYIEGAESKPMNIR